MGEDIGTISLRVGGSMDDEEVVLVAVKSMGRGKGAFMPMSSRSEMLWSLDLLARLTLVGYLAGVDSSSMRSFWSSSASSSLSTGSPLPGTPSPRAP